MPAINPSPGDATDATLDFDLINERAQEQGLSKSKLAELAKVDQSTIWRYRNGKSSPKLEIAERIADVLGVSVDELRRRKPSSIEVA